MKKIFSLITLILIFASLLPTKMQAATDDNYFIVTAYYSPLPDQQHYLTGNYEDEMILNGRGIAGASGKPVFSGMLAAPKKYGFGTKIYLQGLGVGAVEDRGGAIVPAGQRGYSYDRIDVWMGYGDEGLRRALYWGKRKVYGHPVASNKQTNLDYSIIPSPIWATKGIKKNTAKAKQVKSIDIFGISLGKGSDSKRVSQLQQILGELGYLSDSYTDGKYDTATIDAVYNFQVESKILDSTSTPGAGSYGPKTRKKLKIAYNEYLTEKREKEEFLEKIASYKEDALTKAEKHVISLEKPLYGEISPRVRELQKTLHKLGYFDYKDTAIFGVKTKTSLVEYQLAHGLIGNEDDAGAGTFGPKTRAHFTVNLQEGYFHILLKENEMLEAYNLHIMELDDSITHEENANDVSILDYSQVM